MIVKARDKIGLVVLMKKRRTKKFRDEPTYKLVMINVQDMKAVEFDGIYEHEIEILNKFLAEGEIKKIQKKHLTSFRP